MPRRRAKLLTGRAGVRETKWHGERVFYRVTGYEASDGRWYTRNPRTGHWYRQSGRHNGRAPTVQELQESRSITIEAEVGGEIKYFAVHPGMLG